MRTRTSFRFAPDGRHAACLTCEPPGAWQVELWPLDPPAAPCPVPELHPREARSQVLPLDGGAVLLCQPSSADAAGPEHAIVWCDAAGAVRELASVRARGLRLVEHPGPGALAVAISTSFDGSSRLWRIGEHQDGSGPVLEPLVTVPGLIGAASWLDTRGRFLGLNQAHEGRVRAMYVDTGRRSVEELLPDHPDLRLLRAVPDSGVLMVANGVHRLGWVHDEAPGVHWPDAFRAGAPALPLDADPSGERVVVRTEAGAESGLSVLTLGTGQVETVPLPDGVVGGVASWTSQALRFPFAGPGHPAGIAQVRVGDGGSFTMLGCHAAPEHAAGPAARHAAGNSAGHGAGPIADLRLERFAGPAGPVEAVVYGDWRAASSVVLALHGGPDAAWRLSPDAVLARLAAAGTAVVAVNPRGGQGAGDQGVLHQAWGGPDLADVRAVAAAVATARGDTLGLMGASYGAFLALLALGADPERWSRAAVIGPFLSGPRLAAGAGPRVRALLDRLGGDRLYADELGPRDVLHFADRIRAPLMLVHGARDEVIPVAHARELHQRLRDAGRPVTYVEVPGAGHDPFTPGAAESERLLADLTGFLSGAAGMPTGAPQTPPRDPAVDRIEESERRCIR